MTKCLHLPEALLCLVSFCHSLCHFQPSGSLLELEFTHLEGFSTGCRCRRCWGNAQPWCVQLKLTSYVVWWVGGPGLRFQKHLELLCSQAHNLKPYFSGDREWGSRCPQRNGLGCRWRRVSLIALCPKASPSYGRLPNGRAQSEPPVQQPRELRAGQGGVKKWRPDTEPARAPAAALCSGLWPSA